MGEIINLNRARKARDKAADKAQAAQNRIVHGRDKAGKDAARIARERQDRALDGARLGPDDAGSDQD